MTRRKLLEWCRRVVSALFWAVVLAPVAAFIGHRTPTHRTVVFGAEEQTGCAHKEGVFLFGRGAEAVALSGCCTHLGCGVRFDAATRTFRCPCHRSVYDAGGRRLAGPARADLARLAVRARGDGMVEVDVPV